MEDLYFKNKETRIIFGLVELEGAAQIQFLGADVTCYLYKDIAKKWYEKIKEIIKNSDHPNIEIAIENLNKLYKGMGGKIKL